MSAFRVVLRKELRDNLRDRRSMSTALLMPLLGPVMLAAMMNIIVRTQSAEAPLKIAVVGAERASNLIAFLRRSGAQIEPAPPDFAGKIQAGELALALSIPADYEKDFVAGRTAKLELTVDNSRSDDRASVRRVEQLLNGYGEQLAGLRLLARGVSPALAAPIAVDEIDLATPEKMAGFVLGIIPMFLLMTAFTGGMYLAIDSTAGERERGSLEPLLLNPVTPRTLILGKWTAVCLTAAAALGLCIAAFAIALRVLPLQELGVRTALGLRPLGQVLAVLLPVVLFSSAGQMLVSLFARSYKEAQTYLSLIILVPTLPAAFLAVSPVKTKLWMMLLPLWGQSLMLSDVVRGEPIALAQLAVAGATAILCAAIFVAVATRMLGRDAIVFGRTQSGG